MRIWRYEHACPPSRAALANLLAVKSPYQFSPKGFIRLAVGFNPVVGYSTVSAARWRHRFYFPDDPTTRCKFYVGMTILNRYLLYIAKERG